MSEANNNNVKEKDSERDRDSSSDRSSHKNERSRYKDYRERKDYRDYRGHRDYKDYKEYKHSSSRRDYRDRDHRDYKERDYRDRERSRSREYKDYKDNKYERDYYSRDRDSYRDKYRDTKYSYDKDRGNYREYNKEYRRDYKDSDPKDRRHTKFSYQNPLHFQNEAVRDLSQCSTVITKPQETLNANYTTSSILPSFQPNINIKINVNTHCSRVTTENTANIPSNVVIEQELSNNYCEVNVPAGEVNMNFDITPGILENLNKNSFIQVNDNFNYNDQKCLDYQNVFSPMIVEKKEEYVEVERTIQEKGQEIKIKEHERCYTEEDIHNENPPEEIGQTKLIPTNNFAFSPSNVQIPNNLLSFLVQSKISEKKNASRTLLCNPLDSSFIEDKNEFYNLFPENLYYNLTEQEISTNLLTSTINPTREPLLILDENRIFQNLPPHKSLKNEIFHFKKKLDTLQFPISSLTEKIDKHERSIKLLTIEQNEIRKSLNEIFSDL